MPPSCFVTDDSLNSLSLGFGAPKGWETNPNCLQLGIPAHTSDSTQDLQQRRGCTVLKKPLFVSSRTLGATVQKPRTDRFKAIRCLEGFVMPAITEGGLINLDETLSTASYVLWPGGGGAAGLYCEPTCLTGLMVLACLPNRSAWLVCRRRVTLLCACSCSPTARTQRHGQTKRGLVAYPSRTSRL